MTTPQPHRQAVCGFCQGDGIELIGAHTDDAHLITCTHCGGTGTGLTREQAEARQFRIGRVVTYLAGKESVRAEVDSEGPAFLPRCAASSQASRASSSEMSSQWAMNED